MRVFILFLVLLVSSCNQKYREPIVLNSFVSSQSMNQLYKEVSHRHLTLKIDKDITIYLNSNGGDTQSMLIFIDKLNELRKEGRRFTGVIYGFCYSACGTLFAAMDHRYMTKDALYMQHNSSYGVFPKPEELKLKKILDIRRLRYTAKFLKKPLGYVYNFFTGGGYYVSDGRTMYKEKLIDGIVPQPIFDKI